MKSKYKVAFFDLFFTLVVPSYNEDKNEYDVLGLSKEEYESFAEAIEIYEKRATGMVKKDLDIINDILVNSKIKADENQKLEILILRQQRFKNSLKNVSPVIIEVLSALKKNGIKLCLISNADMIDVNYWSESPLYNLFDAGIFSHEVGYLKPKEEIYKAALAKMNCEPEEAIFIGDGGSNELVGARDLGIKTVCTSYLLEKSEEEINKLKEYADFYIEDFCEIESIIITSS